MNPYIQADLGISKISHLYAQEVLNGTWPETEPVSSGPYEVTVSVIEHPSASDTKTKSTCTLLAKLDDELILATEGTKWFQKDNWDLIWAALHTPNYEVSSRPQGYPKLSNLYASIFVATPIYLAFEAWIPSEPTEKGIAEILIYSSEASLIRFSPHGQLGFPISIGYGIYKNKTTYAITGIDRIYTDPIIVSQKAFEQWIKILENNGKKTDKTFQEKTIVQFANKLSAIADSIERKEE